MKFFINMCSSDYIERPNCEAAKDEKGGVGYNWKIPNSLGKIRYDQDKRKLYFTQIKIHARLLIALSIQILSFLPSKTQRSRL